MTINVTLRKRTEHARKTLKYLAQTMKFWDYTLEIAEIDLGLISREDFH